MKNVLLFIDSISFGGAQRQLTGLAKLLQKENINVKVTYYHNLTFYADFLNANNIKHECIPGAKNKFKRLFKINSFLRKENPDVIISYLDVPNMIIIFLKILGLKSKIIVSERNATNTITLKEKIKFFLYRFTDNIISNSHSQAKFINENYPNLSEKLTTIINFVDTNFFHPKINFEILPNKILKIATVARFEPQKNAITLIEAIKILNNEGYKIEVDWYGNTFFKNGQPTIDSKYF